MNLNKHLQLVCADCDNAYSAYQKHCPTCQKKNVFSNQYIDRKKAALWEIYALIAWVVLAIITAKCITSHRLALFMYAASTCAVIGLAFYNHVLNYLFLRACRHQLKRKPSYHLARVSLIVGLLMALAGGYGMLYLGASLHVPITSTEYATPFGLIIVGIIIAFCVPSHLIRSVRTF